MKISVIGMGKVGAATAFSLVIRAIPHELVLVARTREKALGDALDLQHAAAMVRSMEVIAFCTRRAVCASGFVSRKTL